MKEFRKYCEICTPERPNKEKVIFDFELAYEDLENKIILDIGSGEANVADYIKKRPDLSSNVISLDTKYDIKTLQRIQDDGEWVRDMDVVKKTLKKLKKDKSSAIAGLAEKLPFKDKSIDLIVSRFAVPFYTREKEELTKNLKEIIRVLKPGGKIRFYPVEYGLVSDLEEIIDKYKDIDIQMRGRLAKIKKQKLE